MKILALISMSLVLLAACDKKKDDPGQAVEAVHCYFRADGAAVILQPPNITTGTYASGGMNAFYYMAKTGDEKFQVNMSGKASIGKYNITPGTSSALTVSYTNDSGYVYILREGSMTFGTADSAKHTYQGIFSGVFKNQLQQDDSLMVTDGNFLFK